MLKTKYKYRKYCKCCENFTIHDKIYYDETNHKKYNLCNFSEDDTILDKSKYICDDCDTIYAPIDIEEISEDKIEEQRKRYKNYKVSSLLNNPYLNPQDSSYKLLKDIMSEVKIDTEIIESDAGYEKMIELKNQEFEKEKQNTIQYLLLFKNLKRNDKCICKQENNIKYKKCCLNKNNELLHTYNLKF